FSLFCSPPVHGLDVWRVTYTPDHICALDGSAVDISCTYTYPSTGNDRVEEIIWFTKVFSTDAVDLRRDSDYTGRVQYYCKPNSCTVRKTSLRKSNSAEYKFRIITNYGSFTGSPGVTLYVTVSLSAEIMEGSSVTLTCSSDADSAANHTWNKKNQTLVNKSQQLVFSSIQVSDSGDYSCTAENQLGKRTSEYIFINNEDSPKASGPTFTITDFTAEHNGNYHCEAQNTRGRYRFTLMYVPVPLVLMSSSGEIMKGSSVTLTCSSDANPAATYTWYKENEDSPNASGQTFATTDFRAEHSGNYYCEAQNTRGRQKSTSHPVFVAGKLCASTYTGLIILDFQ
uniref:Ig-like domain-containing protein n=1 Tax=Amphiprion ocellaris TaxID=80972 RepID=A0AAQ6A9A2_AMPOC